MMKQILTVALIFQGPNVLAVARSPKAAKTIISKLRAQGEGSRVSPLWFKNYPLNFLPPKYDMPKRRVGRPKKPERSRPDLLKESTCEL